MITLRLVATPLVAASALVMAGCSVLLEAPKGPQAPEALIGTTPEAAIEAKPLAFNRPIPGATLNQNAMYQLLVAELAGRRGRLNLAVTSYLNVAKQTREPAVAERAVRIAVFARDEPRGLEAAKLWTEVAPQSTDARQVHAALLLRAGKAEQALVEFRGLIENYGGRTEEAFAQVGDMLSRERDKATAVEVMEKLVVAYEDDIYAQGALANLLARSGRLEDALERHRKVLALDPGNEQALIFSARILQRQNDTSSALDLLSDALKSQPTAETLRMTYARLLVDAKRYDEARVQFERLARESPDNTDVKYALGLLLIQTERFDLAQEQFEALIGRSQRVPEAYYYLGQIAESRKAYQEAMEAYRRVDRGEHRLNAQIRTAVLLADQDNVPAAQQHLHGLRAGNKQETVRIYRAEAEILTRRERYDDAMKVYELALGEVPKDTDLLYARAMLAEKMDDLIILERDLRDILEREPNNADALNALGYTLADRTNRYDEALELVQRAYELKPNDHYVVDSLGWVYYRLGKYQEAVTHLTRALELSEDPEVAAHLGEVLWVMGNEDAAREVWDTALKTTPDDPRLLDVKKRFEK